MIQDQFQELQAAIEAENRDRAVEITADLLDAYDQDRARIRALSSLARSARESAGGTGPVVEAAQDVLETASRTNETKIDVDTQLLGYVSGEEPGELVSTLTTAIETHNEFDKQVNKFQTELADSDTDVPGFVTLVAPSQFVVPKGVSTGVEIVVRNDTPDSVEDVTLSIASNAPLTLSTTDIGRLPSGTTETVELSGTPKTGEYQPTITATVNDRTDSVSPYLLIQNKRTYLEQALDELVDLYEDLAIAAVRVDGSGNGGNSSRQNKSTSTPVPSGIDNTMREIARRTLQIINQIAGSTEKNGEQGGNGPPSNAINNQIGSVINQIEALQSQISAQGGTGIYADAVPQLRRDAGALIDIYEEGQDAKI